MLDIENKKYSARKEYEYDDDTAVLFYRGTKIAKALAEDFRKYWVEESWNCEDESVGTLLEDMGYDNNLPSTTLDDKAYEDDMAEKYEDIWENLDWNEETKSYKYKDWELIILDI